MTKYIIQEKKTIEVTRNYYIPSEHDGKYLSISDALEIVRNLNENKKSSKIEQDFEVKNKNISRDISFVGLKN